jgi:serine/threonine protein kinase/WD40 repeat protein/DNA-binding winged helix-turn-helix (wHTH) protein
MQIQVLGSIEARSGAEISLGGPTQRRILAMLALDAGDIVSVDRLVDSIWTDDELPANPERNIRSYIHRLRASLGDDLAERIETVPPGYRLRLDNGELDAARFEELASTAVRQADGGDAVTALETIDAADALWSGRPYGQFADEEWAVAESERLSEIHLANREQRIGVLIVLDQAQKAAAEAEALARELPLREGPRALLMRTLYHSGRQPEALRAFQDYRELLAEEIGVDPSEDLVALDLAIASGRLPDPGAETRRVGSYQIHERTGEGAFAVVYRGTQLDLEREVAIKAIRAELANQPDFIRSFEAEAQLIAHLEHPHIVPLYDYWREPDHAYLVMRWLPGGTLDEALADGPWSTERTLRMVEEVGAALALAHRAGVIHRDVKPANIMLDRDGNTFLTDFGIALDTAGDTDLAAGLLSVSGEYASPEQLRHEPAGPAADIYGLALCAARAMNGLTGDPLSGIADLEILAVLQKGTAEDPLQRYQQVEAFVAELAAAMGSNTAPIAVARPGPSDLENPYKGLRAFGEGDADDFYGRERLVGELLEVMNRPGPSLLAVVGASGSGKSSLVRAGLLPALRDGAVEGSDRWFMTTMLPGVDPFEALEVALLRVAVNPPASLRAQLADSDRGILRSVRRVLPDDSTPLLLAIDQFEEVFTLCEDDSLRSDFLAGLATAVTEPGSLLRVVITLRADFYDRPLRHPEFASLVKEHMVTVTPLAGDELEQAIVAPAANVGVEFEPGLVAELIAATSNQPGSLPLLQYTLTELFERDDSGVLSQQNYADLGGLAGALALRANDLYQVGSAAEQAATRRLFGRLITLGEGVEDTRRRVLMSELTPDRTTSAVIERFGRARLLTFDRDITTREPTVEVAHEAIIREWPRLRGWLEKDRQGLRIHRHLTTTAAAWNDRGRDDGDLYRGVRLEAAEAWVSSANPALNALESEFLETSSEDRDAEVEADRRRTRRLRRLLVTTATVAAIALVAGAFAIREQRRANDQADLASEQAELASEGADAAADSSQRADEARAAGDLERLRAVAQSAATQTPALAALLAVEAHRLDPSTEGLDAIHRALTAVPGFRGAVGDQPYFAVKTYDGGERVVALGVDSIDVWDLETRQLVASVGHPGENTEIDITVSVDGAVVAAPLGGSATAFYDLTEGEASGTVQHAAPVTAVSVAPQGDRLAAALTDGRVEIWDVENLEVGSTIQTGVENISFVEWDPAGDRLAVVSLNGEVQFWDPGKETLVWAAALSTDENLPLANAPNALLFTSDGDTLVVDVGVNGSMLHVFDTTDGSRRYEPTPSHSQTLPPLGIFWLDEDALIIAHDNAVTINSFDLTTGEQVGTISGGLRGTFALARSDALEQVVLATPRGLELWSTDGTGPLERAVPLSPGQKAALTEHGGFVLSSLTPDGSQLILSLLSFPAIPPAIKVDLTSDAVPREIFSREALAGKEDSLIVQGHGEYTLVYGLGGLELLDGNLAPMGPPVPLPADISIVAASTDGRFFAVSRFGGFADLYTGAGELVNTFDLGLPDGNQEVFGATVSSDGELIAGTTRDELQVWSTDTQETIVSGMPQGWRGAVFAGNWLVGIREDGAVIVVDPHTLEPVAEPLIGHTEGVTVTAFDEVNSRLVTMAESVRVWDLETGRQLGRELPLLGGTMEFTADGSVLSVPTAKGVSLWNFDTDTWVEIACQFAGRNLTEDEWEQVGPRTVERRATCPQYPL